MFVTLSTRRLALVLAAALVAVTLVWRFATQKSGSAVDGVTMSGDPRGGRTGDRRADAVVIVDSTSPGFADFGSQILPYLDHFGVPFEVLDISRAPVAPDLDRYSLIIIGHRSVDGGGEWIDADERAALEAVVERGVGLVNFDNDFSPGGTSLQVVAQRAFGFAAQPSSPTSDVTFVDPSAVTSVDLWRDEHQEPVLAATSDARALDESDGRWTEYYLPARGFASVMAGVDEFERHALPPERFSAAGLPAGDYDVVGTVYVGPPGRDLRYFYGFAGESPLARHIDAVGGSAGSDEHTEYTLGRVTIDRGAFELNVQDADLLRGSYPIFGWARIRLIKVTAEATVPHYITARKTSRDMVRTGAMTMAGVRAGDDTHVLAFSGAQPLLAVATLGTGRIVQWGSYDWMRTDVRGPLGGLDDLVWRSFAWAARKPFVMQMLPPVLTMRVDDESGPLDWLHTAVEVGFKPWVGVFLSHIDDAEARELSAMAQAGVATVSVHSFDDTTFFYFDHAGRREWPASTMASNLRRAREWHRAYGIPASTLVVPHYYEIGANALPGLTAMQVEFLATHMAPGGPYGMPWLQLGPFRRYTHGSSMSNASVYYADFLDVPGHPELRDRIFNCVTEVRDDAGYEWYPSPEADVTIGRGVRQIRRALDSRAIATLFTHAYFITPIPAVRWRAILESIAADVAEYHPAQMTLDDACALARGHHTSAIASARLGDSDGQLRLTLTGHAEVPTSVAVFDGVADEVTERTEWLPPFTAESTFTLPAGAPSR